ncbi:MAG: HPr family phosphocarrier protein [Candidatus Hydrogenedentota bacterium]|nr:MAG: HPr family phosphocarrier protein [Candidatus Hydrogenedentota bacterium]
MAKQTSPSDSASFGDPNSAGLEIVIPNKAGLHARAAALLVQCTSKFPCTILMEKDGEEVNAKSIMGVMMLAATCGSRVRFRAEGERAREALEAVRALIDRKFDEPE